MLDRPALTETVFTSPDPRETEELRRLLTEHGLEPEMRLGADPVTGVGGWVYGGGLANFYNLDVPVRHAERARKLLGRLAGPARLPPRVEEPVEEARSPRRRRSLVRTGLWGLVVVYAGWLVAWLVLADTPGDAALALGLYGGVALVAVLAVRAARRRP